ncbi:hypothetical protein A2U01_0101102, partial [Trifolium medium]|nr:hypothetical protein [Trifolium medium]
MNAATLRVSDVPPSLSDRSDMTPHTLLHASSYPATKSFAS